MSRRTNLFYQVLNVVSWIIFVGVCIEAGAFIFNAIITLAFNPDDAKKFWRAVDLSALHQYDESRFITLTSLMIIVAVLRAVMFYFIVKLFHDKKLDLSQPFNQTVNLFILKVAYLSLAIGLFSFWGAKVTDALVAEGVKMPALQTLRLAGTDVWLFMGVVLLVIAHIFKTGIELQTENELTV